MRLHIDRGLALRVPVAEDGDAWERLRRVPDIVEHVALATLEDVLKTWSQHKYGLFVI